MATSIFHRATGAALYAGTILLTAWLASAALGENAYNAVQGIYGSVFGKIVLAGYSWAICFHLLNGIKYLFADNGIGLQKEAMTRIAWIVLVGSFVLTAIIWVIALNGGA